MVSGSFEGDVKFWKLKNDNNLEMIKTDKDVKSCARIVANKDKIIISTTNGLIVVNELDSLKSLFLLKGHHEPVSALQIAFKGKYTGLS